MRKTDLKNVPIDEEFQFPCTFFVNDGAPEMKTCTFQILKLFPGGNEAVIATAEANLAKHFGEPYAEKTYELEVSKHAQGSNCRKLTFSATIKPQKDKDMNTYREICNWNKIQHQMNDAHQSI